MTSPSDSLKRRLLQPIEDLFQEAIEGMELPETGGRNYTPPNVFSMSPSDGSIKQAKKSTQSKRGQVDEKAFAEAMIELNAMIGLNGVKTSIRQIADFARIEAQRQRLRMPPSDRSYHCIFSGSPGTGKTTVARLLGKIYKSLGLLKSGHTVEASKSTLVGMYLGETPHRVERVFDDADGGILFIDEAYSLVSGAEDMYGTEAIESIVKLMEDRRDRVIIIAAGYPIEMRKFVNANPGLRSRFNRSIYFADYSAEQLQEMLQKTCQAKGFETTDGFLLRSELLWERLEKYNLTSESNGRLVRNAFDLILEKQAERLTCPNKKMPESKELCQLLPQDLDGIEERIRENIDD